jgi:hypothetical protein
MCPGIAGGCVKSHLVKAGRESLVDLAFLEHPPLVHRLFREQRREKGEEARQDPTDREDKDHLRKIEEKRSHEVSLAYEIDEL